MLEAHQESRKANLRATMEVINRSRDLLKTHGGALDGLVSRRDLGDLDEESMESSEPVWKPAAGSGRPTQP